MSDGRVTLARDGTVARITLDRPAKLNALTPAMLAALAIPSVVLTPTTTSAPSS